MMYSALRIPERLINEHQFSYLGQVYTIPKKHCMVAYRVNLHIDPQRSIRVWHNDKFICELLIASKQKQNIN